MNQQTKHGAFALCVNNTGYEADLDVGTIYVVLPDEQAAEHGRLRVVEESGEDYLCPQHYFTLVELSQSARKALSSA